MPHIPTEDFSNRWTRFQDRLSQMGVDGALLVQKTDLYYFSGTDQDAHLWIPASGPPLLMVRRSLERAREDAAFQQIVRLGSLSQLPEMIQGAGFGKGSARIGLEMDVLPANRFLTYQRLFPGSELMDISPAVRETRMIKSPYEMGCITAAARMADAMYARVPQFLKESERDIDLTGHIEAWYRRQGHCGIVPTRSFNHEALCGQIMSGKGAAMPSSTAGATGGKGIGPFFSHGASMDRIEPHAPILIDYAANANGYIADETRIFSIGALKEAFVRAHHVARNIQDTLAEKGVPGERAHVLYDLAVTMAQEAGLGEGFMGHPDPVPFVGHGVGLELDELPVIGRGSQTLLAEGMVIALEPKFVFPGEGVVGIENTFVVTPTGMKRLNRFPDDIHIC